ncbi:MAG: hypothetical protein F3745_01790 [Nitrospinae bacterium]|nr:hypothetical protein [Nitrospinota bacterium]
MDTVSEKNLMNLVRLAIQYADGRQFVDYSDMNDNWLHRTPNQIRSGQEYYDGLIDGWDRYNLSSKIKDRVKLNDIILDQIPSFKLKAAQYVRLDSHSIWWGPWNPFWGRTMLVFLINGSEIEKPSSFNEYFIIIEELGNHESKTYAYVGMISKEEYYKKVQENLDAKQIVPKQLKSLLPTKLVDSIALRYPLSEYHLLAFSRILNKDLLRQNAHIEWNHKLLIQVLDISNNSGEDEKDYGEKGYPVDPLVFKYDDTISKGSRYEIGSKLIEQKKADFWKYNKYPEHAYRRFGQSREVLDYTGVLNHISDGDFWDAFSENRWLSWSPDLINQYKHRWNWNKLSANRNIPWNKEMVAEYEDHIVWYLLAGHSAFPWNHSMLWFVLKNHGYSKEVFHALSGIEDVPWSENLIDQFIDAWDWHALSYNEGLPWSEELIRRLPYQARLSF